MKRSKRKKPDEPVEIVIDDSACSIEFVYADGVVNRISVKDKAGWNKAKSELLARLGQEGYQVVDERGGVTRLRPKGPGEEEDAAS